MGFYRTRHVPSAGEVFTTNLLAFIFACLTIILGFILLGLFGWSNTTPFTFSVPVLFFFAIVLNRAGYYNAGRLILCLVPVWFAFFISLYGKWVYPATTYVGYFDIRYILLATAIIPVLVFDRTEKWQIILCLSSTFICLLLFDPINNWIGVGYYQRGFTARSYYYVNYVVFISLTALISGILILKRRHGQVRDQLLKSLEENEKTNLHLIEKNKALQNLTNEMEAQNEEILQQHEEMATNQEILSEANQLISEQKQKLERYNLELEKLVEEKSGDLTKTNMELVQSNNELRQFSFNISHNLRGPVARILGLTNLLHDKLRPEELPQAISYIQQAASELDSVLKDLSTIIDIRNELYRVREKINLEERWKQSLMMIGDGQLNNLAIHKDFSDTQYVFGIKPMVQSILFNLISNSIKYKSPDRPLIITAKSWTHTEQTIVEVSDNGMGFDMTRHNEDVFKLYKRFHTHVTGKGMGLYLVRSQMQIMNGRVEVESRVNQGTTFRLFFPIPTDADKQVFFENDSTKVYYDAFINNTVIVWKKNVTSEEYRQVFESVLNSLKKYNTPGWIADLRLQGPISPEDQSWFIKNVLSVASANGLKQIAAVGFHDPVRKDYYERMKEQTKKFNIEMRVFSEIESAVLWMKSLD